MKNNNNNHNEKKKKFGHNRFWATAQLYSEKIFFLLQYSFCIAERKRIEGCLY